MDANPDPPTDGSTRHSVADLFKGYAEGEGIEQALAIIRRHLQMDVAFVSRFETDDRVMTHVDSAGRAPIHVGQRIPLTSGYCLKVARGELPQCIPDTAEVPAALAMPETHQIPIGSHMSVPIRLEDGVVYGTLCCFGYQPNASLGERDLQMLRGFAEMLALRFVERARDERLRQQIVRQIESAVHDGALRSVYQPVWDIRQGRIRGFECLSRFDVEPRRPPDVWFRTAAEAGIGLKTELIAIRQALQALEHFPRPTKLNVNSSPELILSGELQQLIDDRHDLSRIVLEVTEHAQVPDYAALARALRPLRDEGVGLAVDDAGAGYSSMRHILNLEPDIIKLDMSLTQAIDTDARRKALAKGLTTFAHEIGALVVAEGVETAGELDTLARLGVDCAQGYFFARPLGFDEALAYCRPN